MSAIEKKVIVMAAAIALCVTSLFPAADRPPGLFGPGRDDLRPDGLYGQETPAQAEAPRTPLDRLKVQLEKLVRDREGKVGIAVKHLESGQELHINADDVYPMASVFKLPVLVELMAQTSEGRLSLDEMVDLGAADLHLGSGVLVDLEAPGIRLSLRNLALLMMKISDNSAADLVLARVGAESVNRRLRGLGLNSTSVSRPCQKLILDLYGLDYATFKDRPAEEIEKVYEELLRNEPKFAAEVRRSFSLQPEDQSTPRDMNALLEKIFKGEALEAALSREILDIMLRCQTGNGRLKGRLPAGTEVAHKTGTLGGTVNDCGIIFLPDGRGHVVLSVLSKDFNSTPNSAVEAIIAETAKFVYDFFYFGF